MAELKARREGKQRREEAETARREEQRKKDEEEAVSSKQRDIKLKASDIYSDDSESDGKFRSNNFDVIKIKLIITYLSKCSSLVVAKDV